MTRLTSRRDFFMEAEANTLVQLVVALVFELHRST